MAHYAKLGINSKVIAVHVVADKDCKNADGIEDEEVGRQFLENIFNWPLWKKTSYNTARNKHTSGDDSKALRGNYAGIGMTYDEDNDIFIHKKPYPSWVLNIATASWESPIGAAPEITEEERGSYQYDWNESTGAWDKIAV
mgnify:CR=1 FL=1|tara:strand:- start:162 stop:584 length:423 start_codon:yes stop_codon:yes gene_type:complete